MNVAYDGICLVSLGRLILDLVARADGSSSLFITGAFRILWSDYVISIFVVNTVEHIFGLRQNYY